MLYRPCQTGKVRYLTALGAHVALWRIRWRRLRGARHRRERRVYRCGLCGAWHLTSQPKR